MLSAPRVSGLSQALINASINTAFTSAFASHYLFPFHLSIMASLQYLLFTSFLLFFVAPGLAQQSFRPKDLVVPVSKDSSTLQYLTTINQRTPFVLIRVVVDLGGRYLWVDCDRDYVSSTYRPARCGSAQCSLAGANGCGDCFDGPRPGCNNNSCAVGPGNTVTDTAGPGEVAQDVASLQSTDGRNPGRVVTVPRFLFTCAPTSLLQGLANGVVGMTGYGRYRIGLSSQFSAAFSFRRKFAICLSSANGVIFFDDGPYVFLPGVDASESLTFTPLFINPISTAPSFPLGEPSAEYFIGVKSIKVNEKPVSLNTTLLSINSEAAARNITRVAGVAPFEVCFSSRNIVGTRLGAAVPSIDLVLQNENTFWRIFGANSMVEVSREVSCLGFVNGGSNPMTSIIIRGYQLEDTLLQFDLATSRLGFSSTLLGRQITCANFNFTSKA
ncbi:basic 7S globulin 2-like [Gossypium australe]|uniref:Basic 7S globulin 2-like n=1 Tax=Gossypium australe TaxID=47621 RepID=A0A5B6VPR8_9ROSI|nr:basic 7S globulin 2-like [Gossypium australe]